MRILYFSSPSKTTQKSLNITKYHANLNKYNVNASFNIESLIRYEETINRIRHSPSFRINKKLLTGIDVFYRK